MEGLTECIAEEAMVKPNLMIPVLTLCSLTALQIMVMMASFSLMKPQETFRINWITGETGDIKGKLRFL